MRSTPMNDLPVVIAGAGPVGLITALSCAHHGLDVIVLEEDEGLSRDTKAGTVLPRTLEVLARAGAADRVLARALRVEEVGDLDRATGQPIRRLRTAVLRDDTAYPFMINMPQHHLEPLLAEALQDKAPGALRLRHRLTGITEHADHVTVHVETPDGPRDIAARWLLGCDGGRSTVRRLLGTKTEGFSLDTRYMLIDVDVDLDVRNARDYPYLAYFADAREWMILVRHPHCWRFLFPLPPGAEEPSAEELRAKVLHFVGETEGMQVLQRITYAVHHRVAERWRQGRCFLLGDAAHLITPMWALGLNTGVLDANALPWRLAFVARGWAPDSLLDGYEREQRPIAVHGSAEMAEAARRAMGKEAEGARANQAMSGDDWGNVMTRSLLGVRLDPEGAGGWSMVKTRREPIRVGDRIPDVTLHGPEGRPLRLHRLADRGFVALHFADARRRPEIPRNTCPALTHWLVSRWDAPLDSGLRDRALLDVGDALREMLGVPEGTVVLLRPDDHVGGIAALAPGAAASLYAACVGAPPPG
jgi:3-(3-hydroxy-phenyl)propionate hydroxylase